MLKNSPSPLSKTKLVPKEQDYSQWYLDVAKRAELFEYSPTPGCIIFLPKSAALWEKVKLRVNGILECK